MQKEKYRRAEEKEALGKSETCEYTGKDEKRKWRNICWIKTSGSHSLTSWKNFMEKSVFLRRR
ncbi:MAG: hypothetical protein Q4P26_02720 [Lachnospiraceae bacterium]|nr:hypothetical protein [Lachnospiraceae bacterium]